MSVALNSCPEVHNVQLLLGLSFFPIIDALHDFFATSICISLIENNKVNLILERGGVGGGGWSVNDMKGNNLREFRDAKKDFISS